MHGQIGRSLAQLIIGVGAKVIKFATSNEVPKKRSFKDSILYKNRELEPVRVFNAMVPEEPTEEVPKVQDTEPVVQEASASEVPPCEPELTPTPEPLSQVDLTTEYPHVTLKSSTLSDAAKETLVIEEVPLVLVSILQGTPLDPETPKAIEFTCTEEVILGGHCNEEAVQVLGDSIRESEAPRDPHSSEPYQTHNLSCHQTLQGLLEMNGRTLTEIFLSTKGKATSSRSIDRACKYLIQQGILKRSRQGGVNDPFRYYLNIDPYKVIELLAEFESKLGSSTHLVA